MFENTLTINIYIYIKLFICTGEIKFLICNKILIKIIKFFFISVVYKTTSNYDGLKMLKHTIFKNLIKENRLLKSTLLLYPHLL